MYNVTWIDWALGISIFIFLIILAIIGLYMFLRYTNTPEDKIQHKIKQEVKEWDK